MSRTGSSSSDLPDEDAPTGARSLELLEAMLAGAPLAMLLVDGDRQIHQLNRAGEAFVERGRGEALGLRVGTALRCLSALEEPRGCGTGPNCERCVVRHTIRDTLENRQPHLRVRAALTLFRESGSEKVHLRVTSSPVELEGKPLALVWLEDATEQERSAETLRAVADYTYDWESWFAPDGSLMWVNPAVEKLTGYSPEDCRAMSGYPLPMVPESDRAKFGERLRKAIAERSSINDFAFPIEHKDGSLRWMAISWQPIYDAQGKHIGLRTSVRDIGERKRAERERQTHVHFLESLDRVNRAIQGTDDVEQMMRDVMDCVLATFECDRAYFVYPCDPEAPRWWAPMERTRPEYPGAAERGLEYPITPSVADAFRAVLSSPHPVTYGQDGAAPIPDVSRNEFGVRAQLAMAVYPRGHKPYMVGVHQCSYDRLWTAEEVELFGAIGQRLSDALTILLGHRELRESEQRFRSLVEHAADTFFLVDPEGRILDVNQSACDSLGYGREELLGMSATEIDVEAEPQRHKERFWDALGPGESVTFEGLHRRKDGSKFPVEVRLGALELAGERLMLGLARDISDRKQAQEALQRSNELLRAIIEAAPAAIIGLDLEGNVQTVWNPAAEKMLGWTAEEVMGRPLPSVPLEGQEEFRGFRERIRAGLTIDGVEVRRQRRDGSPIDYSVYASPMRDAQDRITGNIAILADITERRKAEAERRQLEEQLYHSQKLEAVGQLAGGVAHDFNNLLTVIFGNVEAIAPTLAENPVARRALEGIVDAARQASGVTRSLLTFSSRIPVEKEPVELHQLVRSAAQLLRRTMPAAVSLVMDRPGQRPVWVSADRTQLQQVIINLAINGRDAMSEGGTLRIGVAQLTGAAAKAALSSLGVAALRTDRVARLTVSDTGTGMSPEVKDRVFEPFFTTKPREQGTGLGLAIVHAIVEEHAGSIAVDSSPGKGTTVTLTLPVAEAPRAESAQERAPSPDRAQGELLLVAEDNPNVRGLITTVLSEAGFQVLEAADGAVLMERFAERRDAIRLLIIDVDLPKRSGLDCLGEIRDQGATTPAIIVTGGIEVDPAGLPDGQTVLLRKPFKMSKLRRMALEMVSGRHEPEARG